MCGGDQMCISGKIWCLTHVLSKLLFDFLICPISLLSKMWINHLVFFLFTLKKEMLKIFPCDFLLCRKMLRHTPTPAINIMTDVPPLEMNGRGSPVGGIEPVTTS